MGFYINKNTCGIRTPKFEIERFLIEDGAMPIPEPKLWEEGLVCIVTNYSFEAAGYAYSKEEMERFKRPDKRPRVWLKYFPAAELSGFKEPNKF